MATAPFILHAVTATTLLAVEAGGAAYQQTDNLSSSIIAFGDGITTNDLSFEGQGNDLLIRIGQNDSLRIRDYQRHGIPSMTFNDGSTLSSEDVTCIVGPGDPYRPASQVMQNWHDANIAYRKASAGNDALGQDKDV